MPHCCFEFKLVNLIFYLVVLQVTTKKTYSNRCCKRRKYIFLPNSGVNVLLVVLSLLKLSILKHFALLELMSVKMIVQSSKTFGHCAEGRHLTINFLERVGP